MTIGAEGHQLRWFNQVAGVSATRLFYRLRRAIAEPAGAGIVEAVLGVALISGIGVLVPGHWGLLGIQPHPLWIIVIAIAVRYGVVHGYIAGALAALNYTLFLCFKPGHGIHLPGTGDLTQPLFLFVGGVLIGELVRVHHQESMMLQEQNNRMQEELLGILKDQQALADANAAPESQGADPSTSLHDFYELAKTVNTLCMQTVYSAILGAVSDALKADACALYLWREGQLRLHLGFPEEYPGRLDTRSADTGMAGMVFRDGQARSVHDRLSMAGLHAITDDSILLAGPLKDKNGHVLGVVAVERLPFLKLNAASIQLFDALLQWSSIAIANASEYEMLREHARSLSHGNGGEGTFAGELRGTQILMRLQDEFTHACAEQYPLSLLVIQIEDYPADMSHLIPAFLHALGLAVRRCMRQVDSFGLLDESGMYLLVLPDMPVDGARIVAQCIQTELCAVTRHAEYPFTVCAGAATLRDQVSPEELLAQALPEVVMDASPIPVHMT